MSINLDELPAHIRKRRKQCKCPNIADGTICRLKLRLGHSTIISFAQFHTCQFHMKQARIYGCTDNYVDLQFSQPMMR